MQKSQAVTLSHRRKTVHDREVITTCVGAFIQHDASHHRWSPYAASQWALITSLDDFSRKILFADLFEEETTWAHIKAADIIGLYLNPPENALVLSVDEKPSIQALETCNRLCRDRQRQNCSRVQKHLQETRYTESVCSIRDCNRGCTCANNKTKTAA